MEGAICDAARVDWEAEAYVLERAPETPQQYGKGLDKGEGVTYQPAIRRMAQDLGGDAG